MIKFFALSLNQIGIGKLEMTVIVLVSLIFPTLFIIEYKNLDPKGVFDWMMQKPNDFKGRN